jgi:hypothetical protein
MRDCGMSSSELESLVADLAKSTRELSDDLHKSQKETDRQIRRLSRLFESHWGRLVEALLGAGLPLLFRQRGIPVHTMNPRFKVFDDSGRTLVEIDIMIRNGEGDVAVEVKTTCRPDDVDEHIERLGRLRFLDPAYAKGKRKLYGAVAALAFDAQSDIYAMKQGLFVLKCTESLATIQNPPDFRPRAF